MYVEIRSRTKGQERVMLQVNVEQGQIRMTPEVTMPPQQREQWERELREYQKLAPERGHPGDEGLLRWLPECIRGSYIWAVLVE